MTNGVSIPFICAFADHFSKATTITAPITKRVIKAEIKSMDPWYTFGKSGAMTYPTTDAQIGKLYTNDCVWFLATMTPGTKYFTKEGVTASELHGKIFKINAKKLAKYIQANNENDSPHLYRYNGEQTWDMESGKYEDKSRIAIPFEMLQEVGYIDAKTMQESGINNSQTSHLNKWTNYEWKDWRNLTDKKGYIGEKLMQLEYFKKQKGIIKVSVSADEGNKFAKTDITIIFENQ
tara:strand:+ start:43 stop:747 length:705 start_codon:yes stop_codon:yes gene_type:complete